MRKLRIVAMTVGAAFSMMMSTSMGHAEQTPGPRGHGTGVRDALIQQGYTSTEANAIASDPKLARYVPVSTSFEETRGTIPAVRAAAPQALGTCSGSGAWVQRIQYINNQFGAHIAYVKLRTNFSYNGSRVTCTGSSRSWYIYGWVAPGVVQWKGWTDFTNYFYSSGGRANGGALTSTEGRYSLCLVKCGSSNLPYAETRAYYNGSALTFGHNTVTFP
jgi:hypothetical protein